MRPSDRTDTTNNKNGHNKNHWGQGQHDKVTPFISKQDIQAFPQKAPISDRTVLPLPPTKEAEDRFEMDVYVRFMRHLRDVPNSRMEIKVLSAIQFTADMMDTSDALVSKTLIDLGMRAPRKAFPISFLDFADKTMQRKAWDLQATPPSVVALRDHWDSIGENRFASARRDHYALFSETIYERF